MPEPDFLAHLYSHLPWFLQWPVWFILNIIIIRGILANEIMTELRERGILGKVHTGVKDANRWHSLARTSAIFQHYRLRAQGTGHASKSVLDCGQGHCVML